MDEIVEERYATLSDVDERYCNLATEVSVLRKRLDKIEGFDLPEEYEMIKWWRAQLWSVRNELDRLERYLLELAPKVKGALNRDDEGASEDSS